MCGLREVNQWNGPNFDPTVNSELFTFLFLNLRYDMIQEFNVNSKSECDQLNLAHDETALFGHLRLLVWLMIWNPSNVDLLNVYQVLS